MYFFDYPVNMLQLKNATDAFIRHDIADYNIDQTITWAEMCAVASSMFQSVERQCSSEVVNVARSVDLLTSWAMDIFDVYVTCFKITLNTIIRVCITKACTHMDARMYAHTHTHIHINTHARTHTHINTHTPARTHTHIHT